MEYVLVLAVIVISVLVFKDRPIMTLTFDNGKLTSQKGRIPVGFLSGCKDIAHKQPFSGTVKVYKNRFTTKLVFSKSVPSKVKQRIHNVYPYSGGTKKHGRRA